MALRAKKPVLSDKMRIKMLMYAESDAGKSHFCCSIPNVYYIDTENLFERSPRFRKMLDENGGVFVYCPEPGEITKEIEELMTTKHDFKTVVIDSLSFPYTNLSYQEAKRLAANSKNKDEKEGTEYNKHLAKPKRWLFELAMMLNRLDMNVIVTSHEKVHYEGGKEDGKTFDINDKVDYAMDITLHLRVFGDKKRKAFVEKCRQDGLPKKEFIDFDNGYQTLVSAFGEKIFVEECKPIVIASKEELTEMYRLIKLFNVDEEVIQKWLSKGNAQRLELLDQSAVQAIIKMYQKKIQNVEQPEEV